MISYDAIVTEVTARLGNRQDIASRIGRWINYALFELLLNPRYSFFELDSGPVVFFTAAGVGTYLLTSDSASGATPDSGIGGASGGGAGGGGVGGGGTGGSGIVPQGFWFILDLRDNTNSRRIRRVHYTEIDKVTQTTGQPVRYYRYGNTITLDPVPDATYEIQLRFRLRPSDFVPGSNLILGTEWEEPVITMATIRGFEALDMRNKAQEQRQILEAIMPTRMDVPTLEADDAEPTIQPTLIFPSY
jgi:hypothetical protein